MQLDLQATQVKKATDSVFLAFLNHCIKVYFMAFEDGFNLYSTNYVEQKAFDGRVSHAWLSCLC